MVPEVVKEQVPTPMRSQNKSQCDKPVSKPCRFIQKALEEKAGVQVGQGGTSLDSELGW